MVPDDEFFNVPEELPFDISSPDETQISEDYEDHSSEYMEPCEYTCKTVDDFLRLTDEMVETIIGLEDELVRWRQALIKYLPERCAFCGLRRSVVRCPAVAVRLWNGRPAVITGRSFHIFTYLPSDLSSQCNAL